MSCRRRKTNDRRGQRDPEILSERIYQWREARNLSQSEAGHGTEVVEGTLQESEQGRAAPTHPRIDCLRGDHWPTDQSDGRPPTPETSRAALIYANINVYQVAGSDVHVQRLSDPPRLETRSFIHLVRIVETVLGQREHARECSALTAIINSRPRRNPPRVAAKTNALTPSAAPICR